MVALSSLGYWRTLRVRMAWSPAMMITRLTTMARTGRLMKRSVNFMAAPSVVRGVRSELWVQLHVVVHRDAHAVASLERTGGPALLARLHPVENRHEIAARFTYAHELLSRHLGLRTVGPLDWFARRILLVLHDE